MYTRTTAALLVVGSLVGGAAATIAAAQDQTPVFRVVVVGRTTPAINYR